MPTTAEASPLTRRVSAAEEIISAPTGARILLSSDQSVWTRQDTSRWQREGTDYSLPTEFFIPYVERGIDLTADPAAHTAAVKAAVEGLPQDLMDLLRNLSASNTQVRETLLRHDLLTLREVTVTIEFTVHLGSWVPDRTTIGQACALVTQTWSVGEVRPVDVRFTLRHEETVQVPEGTCGCGQVDPARWQVRLPDNVALIATGTSCPNCGTDKP